MSNTYTNRHHTEGVYPIETQPAEFGPFASFVELWSEKRGDRWLPDWRDFEITDFSRWYGWVCVFDVVAGAQPDFHTRLWGSKVATMLGFDMTGKPMRRASLPPEDAHLGYEDDDMDFMWRLADQAMIGTTEGAIQLRAYSIVRYRDIFLPLSSDQQTVDKLMSATYEFVR